MCKGEAVRQLLTVVSFLIFFPPGKKTSPATPILAFLRCNRRSWFFLSFSSCSANLPSRISTESSKAIRSD